MQFVLWVISLPILCYYALFVFCKKNLGLVFWVITLSLNFFIISIMFFLVCLLLIGHIQFLGDNSLCFTQFSAIVFLSDSGAKITHVSQSSKSLKYGIDALI